MRAVIIASGELSDPDFYRRLVRPDDFLIAADGGAHHAERLGLLPRAVIGDLDSLDGAMHRRLEATGCQLIAHPAHKDETDLELALRYAVDQGATEVLVFGALGGRLDQTLANVLLLALPELRGVRVKIVGPELEVLLVRDQETIEGRPGDTVTLLPIGGDVTGITTEGLEYPLRDGTLYFGPARGVSNALTAPTAHLRVKTGLLLVVHITG